MENVILFRNRPVKLDEYLATYSGDSAVEGKDRRVYYKVDFVRRDSASGKDIERFTLYPDAFINPKGQQGLSANPSTRHYWDRDIFTFINAVQTSKPDDPANLSKAVVRVPGDSVPLRNGAYMILQGFKKLNEAPRYELGDSDLGVSGRFVVYDADGKQQGDLHPVYILRRGKFAQNVADSLTAMGLDIRFNLSIADDQQPRAEISIHQDDPMDNYVVLKAIVFPFINVLWIGVMLMVMGFLLSLADKLSFKPATA